MRDAFGFLLHPIGEFTPKITSTSQGFHEVPNVLRVRYDKNVGDSRSRQLLDAMKHHRLVTYRQEMLTDDFCEWMQTGAESTCQDDAFEHVFHHGPPRCSPFPFEQVSG